MDTDSLTARLSARREGVLRDIEDAGDAGGVVELDQTRVGRLSRMDALQTQALAVETRRRRGVELQAIAAALKRIDEGTYGYCLTCGEEIAPARLEYDPTATQCIGCASLGESGGLSRR